MLTIETWQLSFLFALVAAGCWKGMVLVWKGLNVVQQERWQRHISWVAELVLMMVGLYGVGYLLFSTAI